MQGRWFLRTGLGTTGVRVTLYTTCVTHYDHGSLGWKVWWSRLVNTINILIQTLLLKDVFLGNQMAEQLGSRTIYQKVVGSTTGCAKWRCVLGQRTSLYLPRGECPCTCCKSLWKRESAKWLNVTKTMMRCQPVCFRRHSAQSLNKMSSTCLW